MSKSDYDLSKSGEYKPNKKRKPSVKRYDKKTGDYSEITEYHPDYEKYKSKAKKHIRERKAGKRMSLEADMALSNLISRKANKVKVSKYTGDDYNKIEGGNEKIKAIRLPKGKKQPSKSGVNFDELIKKYSKRKIRGN